MKKRLLILSDLWGERKNDWWHFYKNALDPYFEVVFYDCTELAEIETDAFDQKILHEQFINGGIDRAVQKLIDLEKEKTTILAFSIGGTIAWKYSLQTSTIESLYCVSSTRLRKEVIKPNTKIHLWYGMNDMFIPNENWFQELKLTPFILDAMEHGMYKELECVNKICNLILENYN